MRRRGEGEGEEGGRVKEEEERRREGKGGGRVKEERERRREGKEGKRKSEEGGRSSTIVIVYLSAYQSLYIIIILAMPNEISM